MSSTVLHPAAVLALCGVLLTACTDSAPDQPAAEVSPNIVLILADDLGLGDVGSYNPETQIPTPHLDRLAAEGIRFTDAHAPGSWCVPTRYGLLTGRYPFRDSMDVWRQRALIQPDQPTLAGLLQQQGYATALVGKWHLGFEGGTDFDCSEPLRGGPVDHGFDRFFGMHASLDIPPYFYIQDDACVAAPTDSIAARGPADPFWTSIQGPFWREGPVAPGFQHAEVLPRFREQAVAFLEAHQRTQPAQPFFLYLALTAPHTPWLPLEPFQDASGAGSYGDFVVQVDDVVGSVTEALTRLGLADNTLVLFTSDNGPVWYAKDEARFGHDATGGYRGMKGDAWEGGHRMPFVARWPGEVPAGTVSDVPIAFTDLLATFAAILDAPIPAEASTDSYNILPALRGQPEAPAAREALVHTAIRYVALRQGNWKLIPGLGSGGFSEPRVQTPGPGDPIGQLYNLAEDPAEQTNLYDEHPDLVAQLQGLLDQIQAAD